MTYKQSVIHNCSVTGKEHEMSRNFYVKCPKCGVRL